MISSAYFSKRHPLPHNKQILQWKWKDVLCSSAKTLSKHQWRDCQWRCWGTQFSTGQLLGLMSQYPWVDSTTRAACPAKRQRNIFTVRKAISSGSVHAPCHLPIWLTPCNMFTSKAATGGWFMELHGITIWWWFWVYFFMNNMINMTMRGSINGELITHHQRRRWIMMTDDLNVNGSTFPNKKRKHHLLFLNVFKTLQQWMGFGPA